jgi:hypothetical protein
MILKVQMVNSSNHEVYQQVANDDIPNSPRQNEKRHQEISNAFWDAQSPWVKGIMSRSK